MLTDDMTRLCDEIVAMRKIRGNLMSELQHGAKGQKHSVTKLCAHFGRARMTMAKRTKNERVAFLNNLKRSVGTRGPRVGRARMRMANQKKNDLVVFLNNLKRSVGTQRRDMRNDLAGAH